MSMIFSRGFVGDSIQISRVFAVMDCCEGLGVVHVGVGCRDPPFFEYVLHQAVGPAVQVVAQDDVGSLAEQGEDRCRRRQSRRERQSIPASFELGQARLQRGAGRVAGARVLVPLVFPDRFLLVRRGLEHRHDDRAGGRIGLLSRMDRLGFKLHRASPLLRPETDEIRPGDDSLRRAVLHDHDAGGPGEQEPEGLGDVGLRRPGSAGACP